MQLIYKYNVRACAIALASVLMLCACSGSDDDNKDNGSSTAVVNVNKNVITGTSKPEEALRMEVPHLATGRKLVLVKKTSQYGVNYIVEWDCDKKAQRWSCWEWNASNSVKNWNRYNWRSEKGCEWQGTTWFYDPFQEDPDIPSQYQSLLTDYQSSGYNRGHICASEDRICNQDVNGQTFYLSNMQPQIYGFNGGVWVNMENQVRKWNVSEVRDTMWVCKGGTIGNVYLDGKEQTGVIENSRMNIPVPKYFFMALVAKKNGSYKGMAFWAEHKENSDAALAKYMISIDELETRTGIDFFCNLPDQIENSVEAMNSPVSWGLQ